jgi:hypothetical protein
VIASQTTVDAAGPRYIEQTTMNKERNRMEEAADPWMSPA